MKSYRAIRLLTVSDIHQSQTLYRQLSAAVTLHQPDVVACVGDVLDAIEFSPARQFTPAECACHLANLSAKHVVFVRGNHEDSNWTEFIAAWPHCRRPLCALYGSAISVGPLVIIGFPCFTGSEFTWCAHLEAGKSEMSLSPQNPSEELPVELDCWLPDLMRRAGTAGRTLWLTHEPPVGRPLGNARTCNAIWTAAVERFSPRLIISGHDHESPIKNGAWNYRLGSTLCVNVGQQAGTLHYTLAEFEFRSVTSLPAVIRVQAFPKKEEVTV